jgi:hypothetical protein
MLQARYVPQNNPLNTNEWSFPLFECIHIATFAMAIGTIALVDFRLLRVAMRRQNPADLLRATSLWTLIGLIIAISTGLVIFTTDPQAYFYNPSFRFKCIALIAAVIYNYTIHRKTVMSNAGPVLGGVVAGVSLALWISVVFSAIFYSFV